MANTTSTSQASCSEHQVNAAIFGQRPLIGTLLKERMQKQRKYMMRCVSEGATLDPHDDSRTVIITRGLAQAVGYSSYQDPHADTCDGPQLKTGELPGQTGCNDQCGSVQMETSINETEAGACDQGVEIIDYAQGFKYRGYEDAVVRIATKERCIEELAKRERKHVLDYIEQEASFLAETAFLSFDRKLVDLAVKNGGANSVVRPHAEGEPTLTGGGWNPGTDPNNADSGVKHITIYWLERYREQIVELLEAATVPGAEDYVLEVEMTREAWKFALVAESLTRTGDGGMLKGLGEQIRVQAKLDEKVFSGDHMLKGRKFDTWDGKLRIVFNDKPIRGFLKPTGTTTAGEPTYNFIRVNDYINQATEAGLETIPNKDYRRNTVTCDGQTYPLLELIPHIHGDSFTRHNLTQGIGPKGVNPLGANFQIQLLKDEYLSDASCPNFGNKKYRYYIEHKFRWKNTRNEFSGFIMHRRYVMPGYDANISNNELIVGTAQSTATTKDCAAGPLEKCNPDCPEEVCATDGSDNFTSLEPCGSVNTSFYGETKVLRIAVCRESACAVDAAEVGYTVADGTGEKGTHYNVIDSDGNVAPATGSVTWEAGESGCKYICFNILAALADEPDTESDCCETIEGAKNPATFDITLSAVGGTTLGDCKELEVSINNRV